MNWNALFPLPLCGGEGKGEADALARLCAFKSSLASPTLTPTLSPEWGEVESIE